MRTAAPLVLALALLAGCADDAPDTAAPLPVESPSAAAPSPTPTPTAVAGPAETRAIYWLGAEPHFPGERLFREFVQRPAAEDEVRDAVTAMLTLEPSDPDYDSLWPEGTTVRDVTRDGDTAVVDLSSAARDGNAGSGFESMSLQQLVHTVTAADPSLTSVRLLIEGQPVESLWGHTDTSRPLTRAPAIETLGPVWLDVAEGGTISGEFGGTASVFEATVSWELRQDGRVVQEGFSTATEGAPGRGKWTAQADVPPGDYVLWAYESSAQDGSITWLDTKRVTVTG